MTPVETFRGEGPILLGAPHAGTFIPDDILTRLNDRGRSRIDADWHVDRLFQNLLPNATLVRANFHRYVVDANRDPEGTSLYPGQNTTSLCPVTDFDGAPIYGRGNEPTADEVEARRAAWHAPYHAALAAEIARVKAAHGVAILFDCHSIRSEVPFLFEGELPALNIGDYDGAACAPAVQAAAVETCRASGYSWVLNGRFKGGWTTRWYGRPAEGVHAIQMEIAQRAYLSEEAPPWPYDAAKADRLRGTFRDLLLKLEELAPALAAGPCAHPEQP